MSADWSGVGWAGWWMGGQGWVHKVGCGACYCSSETAAHVPVDSVRVLGLGARGHEVRPGAHHARGEAFPAAGDLDLRLDLRQLLGRGGGAGGLTSTPGTGMNGTMSIPSQVTPVKRGWDGGQLMDVTPESAKFPTWMSRYSFLSRSLRFELMSFVTRAFRR